MTVDRELRADLRKAVLRYMRGEIHSYAFDDSNSACCRPKTTADRSLREISAFLYNIHDDFVDHPISVGPQTWAVLRRIVAFLGTDLDMDPGAPRQAWPFRDEDEWRAHELRVHEFELPEYDPLIHGRQVNRWWNRIPSSVGFVVLGGVLGAILILLLLAQGPVTTSD
jgi:hypothetical protein